MKLYQFNNQYSLGQINRMQELEDLLDCDVQVIGTHNSKSIALPVVKYEKNGFEFSIRDNFYDVNLLVKSPEILDIPFSFLYLEKDFSWYQQQIDRKQNYSFQHWSKEEISDPRILRVKMPNGNWSEKKGDEKDRWSNRMSSTEWYGRDWSSGKLIHIGNIPFDKDSKFYHAGTAYAEGIKERAELYTKPCNKFIISCDWEKVFWIIKFILKI